MCFYLNSWMHPAGRLSLRLPSTSCPNRPPMCFSHPPCIQGREKAQTQNIYPEHYISTDQIAKGLAYNVSCPTPSQQLHKIHTSSNFHRGKKLEAMREGLRSGSLPDKVRVCESLSTAWAQHELRLPQARLAPSGQGLLALFATGILGSSTMSSYDSCSPSYLLRKGDKHAERSSALASSHLCDSSPSFLRQDLTM